MDEGSPKVFTVGVLEPKATPLEYDSNYPETRLRPAPSLTTSKRLVLHMVLIHASEVVDRGPVVFNMSLAYDVDTRDTTHTHYFLFFDGCVDDNGPL